MDFERRYEKPLKLETVVEELEMMGREAQTFYNTSTGELYCNFDDLREDEEEELDGEAWITLPDSYDIEDLRWMRDFARMQPDPAGSKLLDAAYARHPYRGFKDTAHELGFLQSWFDYRDERLREVALTWFDRNGLVPPDASAVELDPTTRTILDELRLIEERERVRILFAIESGSRAWGFASPDSDYDVRFVYARPLERYLELEDVRDVIEWRLDDVLDINGWDIRKFLKLMSSSNPSTFEWLASPLVYLDTPARTRIERVGRASFSPKATLHHYLHMAQSTYRAHLQGDTVRTKKYFYVVRPLLAARWVLDRRTPPPLPFEELVEAELEPEIKPLIDDLLQEKSSGCEMGEHPAIGELNRWIETGLEKLETAVQELPRERKPSREPLDELFRDIVLEGDGRLR